jgi:circadian clock protein KaiB
LGERAGIDAKELYRFKLFVSGMSVKSVRAIENLNAICEAHLPGRFHIELIDIIANKALAVQYQIIAIPTLIKTSPEPIRTIVGDLSDTKKVLTILEIE